MRDLVAKGASRIGVINAHLENSWFITEACNLAIADAGDDSGVRIMSADWWAMLGADDFGSVFDPPPGDPSYEHAALVETAMMLHLAPGLVDMTKAPDHGFVEFPPYDVYPAPQSWITESGALAPVLNANADQGRQLVEMAAAKLATALESELKETDR